MNIFIFNWRGWSKILCIFSNSFGTYHFFRLFFVGETNQKETVGSCAFVILAQMSSQSNQMDAFTAVLCAGMSFIAQLNALVPSQSPFLRARMCVMASVQCETIRIDLLTSNCLWNTWYKIHLYEMWCDAIRCLTPMFKHAWNGT